MYKLGGGNTPKHEIPLLKTSIRVQDAAAWSAGAGIAAAGEALLTLYSWLFFGSQEDPVSLVPKEGLFIPPAPINSGSFPQLSGRAGPARRGRSPISSLGSIGLSRSFSRNYLVKHMTVAPAEGRYMTGIHRAPSESVNFVIQTILVMVFNPRLKFFFCPYFFFFFLSPFFFLSEQGNLYVGRIQRGTKEGKTSFSQKRKRKGCC